MSKEKKDIWDKLSAISSLFSGILIAGIGIYATSVYNSHQLESQNLQKERELNILRVQTVEKFFPYLTSKDENEKKGALLAISSLGDEELATNLASHFGGEGSASALVTLAKSENNIISKTASIELAKFYHRFRNSVVQIIVKNDNNMLSAGNGYFFSSDGKIITTKHLIASSASKIYCNYNSKEILCEPISISKDLDLAILKANLNTKVLPIPLEESSVNMLEEIIALNSFSSGLGFTAMPGKIIQIENQVIRSDIKSSPGSSGAPVINVNGKVVGIIQSISSDYTNILSSKEIQMFIKSNGL